MGVLRCKLCVSNQPSAAPTLPPSVAHPLLKAFLIMAAIKVRLALGSD